MAYILQPTDTLLAGCDPQPFWTSIDAATYPSVYRAKIDVQINGTYYEQNGQTAYLIADAQPIDPYEKEFRFDISPVIREYFARAQRDAGDLPLAFQQSLTGYDPNYVMADSFCTAEARASYFEIDGQNHEVASAATADISNEYLLINAATQYDGETSLEPFNPLSGTARFLTNCPQRTLIRIDESAFLSFISLPDCTANGGITCVYYRGYLADGTQVWSRTKFYPSPGNELIQVPTGLRQLKQMNADGDFDLSQFTFTTDIDGYTVVVGCYYEGEGITEVSEVYVYEIADYCGQRIHFKNAFGCIDSVTFTGVNQISNSPLSRLYSRIMDNTVPQTPQMYGRAKYGATDFDIYRLSIDPINEAQRQWLRELQVSPLVCTELFELGAKGEEFVSFLPVVVDDADGLVYDRTAAAYPVEFTMRAARDKFKSVI